MTSIKVAVRARSLKENELFSETKNIFINEKCVEIIHPKLESTHQDKVKQFYFDYCYSNEDQATIYNDIGNDIVQLAHEGFNACIFAYGQTGSGKTYTMIGSPANKGLIHRICENLVSINFCHDINVQSNISYMEIYNEKVRDLIHSSNKQNLKIRENPISGPYVEGLSKYVIRKYSDFEEILIRGNLNRSVASTKINQHSSRSHAIITIYFTQAKIIENVPSEILSKIHMVDLAGSEKSDIANTRGERLKEGSSINKSLTMLACVISALAQTSHTKKKKVPTATLR